MSTFRISYLTTFLLFFTHLIVLRKKGLQSISDYPHFTVI